jgi:hypothetical protein
MLGKLVKEFKSKIRQNHKIVGGVYLVKNDEFGDAEILKISIVTNKGQEYFLGFNISWVQDMLDRSAMEQKEWLYDVLSSQFEYAIIQAQKNYEKEVGDAIKQLISLGGITFPR